MWLSMVKPYALIADGFYLDKNKMRQPGIEPGSHRWKRSIIPLDH